MCVTAKDLGGATDYPSAITSCTLQGKSLAKSTWKLAVSCCCFTQKCFDPLKTPVGVYIAQYDLASELWCVNRTSQSTGLPLATKVTKCSSGLQALLGHPLQKDLHW